MPLSEHEQQLLEQMEQALSAEDPKFASQMQGAGARAATRRRYLIGGLGVLVGLVLVLVGVNAQILWVGAVGFAVMVAAAVFALTPVRRSRTLGAVQSDGTVRRARPGGPGKTGGGGGGKARAHLRGGNFMQRMEQRWERRRHDW